MARGITENEVHAAADALVAGGERPTVERIRAHLGTGSPNTVVRWLDTWWKGLGSRLENHEARLDLPDAPDAVATLAGRWWAVALEHAKAAAEAALATERDALDVARVALERDRAAFSEEAVALRQHRADAAQARDLASARTEELERLIGQLEAQIEEVTGQREAAVLRASHADDERRSVEARLQAIQEQITSERDNLNRHVQAVEDRAHTEVDGARQETRELKQQLAALTRQRSAAEAGSRKQLDEIRNEATRALREAAVQRAKAEALETQLEHLRDLPAVLESALQQAKPKPKPRKAAARRVPAAKKRARVSTGAR